MLRKTMPQVKSAIHTGLIKLDCIKPMDKLSASTVCVEKHNCKGKVLQKREIKFDALNPWDMRTFYVIRDTIRNGNRRNSCEYARGLGWYE